MCYRMTVVAVIFVLLSGGVAVASEAATAPRWEGGDYWEYRIDMVREGSIDRFYRTELLLQLGIRYNITAVTMRPVGTGDEGAFIRFGVGRPASLTERIWFPLWVGKQWTMTDLARRRTQIATVLGFGPVETPAGIFDAFHIRFEERREWTIDPPFARWPLAVLVREVWYSPQVENYVRSIVLRDGEVMSERLLVGYGHMTPQEAIETVFLQIEAALADWALFRGALGSLFVLYQHGIESERAMAIIRAASPPHSLP